MTTVELTLEECLAGMRKEAERLAMFGAGYILTEVVEGPLTNHERQVRLEDIKRARKAHKAYCEAMVKILWRKCEV